MGTSGFGSLEWGLVFQAHDAVRVTRTSSTTCKEAASGVKAKLLLPILISSGPYSSMLYHDCSRSCNVHLLGTSLQVYMPVGTADPTSRGVHLDST